MTAMENLQCAERSDCRLCGSLMLDSAIPLVPTPPGDHYLSPANLSQEYPAFPLHVILCGSCGHLQLSHVVAPSVLYGKYIYTSSISLGLNDHFVNYANDLNNFVGGLKDKFVVDVGSNDGSCLRAFQAQGAAVRGIEPASTIAGMAEESGIPTTNSFIGLDVARRIVRDEGRADLVLANNVFANIDDLDTVVEAIKLLLDPAGLFVFETGYAVDLLESRIVDNIYHEHLSYFAVRPICKFFRKHQMRVVRVVYSPSKGGSIRVFVCSDGDSRSEDPSVQFHIRREEASQVFHLPAFHKLTEAIAREGECLRRQLAEERSNGRSLVGFGASVGVTTLLHLFQVGEMLECLVDDNRSRHGLVSPGYHLAVQPTSKLLEGGSTSVVLFPWRYVEPILKSTQKFLAEGGRFIVPLPEMRVVDQESSHL